MDILTYAYVKLLVSAHHRQGIICFIYRSAAQLDHGMQYSWHMNKRKGAKRRKTIKWTSNSAMLEIRRTFTHHPT